MKKAISITLAVLLVVVGMVSVNATAAGVPTVTLCSASLSLKDSVYIWFDMFFENVDRDADDYGMIFWTSEQASYTYEAAQGNAAAVVRDKAAGEWSHDSTLNRDVVTYKYGVSAKEMADIVYAQGYAKVGESYYYSSVVPYSVVKYASNKLGLTPGVTGTDDENLKTLLRSMLEYGAASQLYFGYNTDNLANKILYEVSGTLPTTIYDRYMQLLTELRNNFLVTRASLYTEANYYELTNIFNNASYEIRRLTTADGIERLLAETESKANAVPNIVSDAAAIQALIADFGDVPSTLFTASNYKVEAAREAFNKWVIGYSNSFFIKNGFTFVYDADGKIDISRTGERKIVDFATEQTNNQIYININYNTNSLLYAEAKMDALFDYAKDAIYNEMVAQLIISGGKTESEATAIVDILFDANATSSAMNKALSEYKSVKNLVEKSAPTYSECEKYAQLIEDCNEVYITFYNANGGDDSPISYVDNDGNVLLTGEQFVKLYVRCLHNGEPST